MWIENVMLRLLILIGSLSLLVNTSTSAQDHLEAEAKIQSIFMYNFAKYIEWPNGANNGEFVIGVLGEGSINEFLQKMSQGKTKGDRKIVIKEYSSIKDMEYCHMFFVPESESKSLSKVVEAYTGKPVLIVSSRAKMEAIGSCVNFIIVDGKIKYELNAKELAKKSFKVAKQLETLSASN